MTILLVFLLQCEGVQTDNLLSRKHGFLLSAMHSQHVIGFLPLTWFSSLRAQSDLAVFVRYVGEEGVGRNFVYFLYVYIF